MSTERKRVILLGATGSIGRSTDRVVRDLSDELQIVALAAHSRWGDLLELVRVHRPRAVALTDEAAALEFEKAAARGSVGPTEVYAGAEGLVQMVREVDAEILVAAISGAAGLPATVAALETGKDLALANKESLVMSGQLLTKLARERGRRILPVDSEHSAIFQSLRSGQREEVRALILTASGGPFRTWTLEQLRNATPGQALKHPTWKMGDKITVDSATLMNKALEVLEAHWLFEMPAERIEVVIHPQSIVHSLVEFHDGSTICQLGNPDMRVPIQYALTFPSRKKLCAERLDLARIGQLSFERPDPDRFPSLRLAYDVVRRGGTLAAAFNAANEVAVACFLDEELAFLDIFAVIEETLEAHDPISDPGLDAIFGVDAWARRVAGESVRRRRENQR
jgi:1-deoxy-D-xylulose-5-phosphate reductoisomerase